MWYPLVFVMISTIRRYNPSSCSLISCAGGSPKSSNLVSALHTSAAILLNTWDGNILVLLSKGKATQKLKTAPFQADIDQIKEAADDATKSKCSEDFLFR